MTIENILFIERKHSVQARETYCVALELDHLIC